MLARIRGHAALAETGRGVFYLKSRAFLHFHEDVAGLFADLRAADGKAFERMQVDQDGGAELLRRVAMRLGRP